MVDLARFLPMKVFCCLPLYLGSMVLMSLIILFRFIAMIIGCLYGPLLYLVLPLGGLYLAVDILLLYVIFGSVGLKTNKNVDEDDHLEATLGPLEALEAQLQAGSCQGHVRATGQEAIPEGNCDFKSQKVWSFTWLILNVVALIGLFVVLGLFANLGWWSMTYDPTGTHVPMFFMVLILSVLLIYGQLTVFTLYLLLKDAYLRGILGNGSDEDMAGLTHGGKRIYA